MSVKRMVWMNGTYVSETDAKVSIFDSALMFGDMVFEMTRSFNKEQFKLREHLERLYDSMKFVHIPLPMPIEEMEKIVLEVIEKNDPVFADDDEHRIMINVSRGILGIYQGIDGLSAGTQVTIADFPLCWTVRGMGKMFDDGVNMVITSQRAIPASLLEPKVKNRSRIHYMMANIEASKFSGENNWALLLDPDGFIAEGTGDNFFMVKDGTIISPEPRNILRGISRDYIFTLAEELDIPCIERNIEPFDVMTGDEAFITGTPFCMLPVTHLNHEPIKDGEVGSITSLLLERWSSNVGVDIKKQIQNWDKEKKLKESSASTPYAFKK